MASDSVVSARSLACSVAAADVERLTITIGLAIHHAVIHATAAVTGLAKPEPVATEVALAVDVPVVAVACPADARQHLPAEHLYSNRHAVAPQHLPAERRAVAVTNEHPSKCQVAHCTQLGQASVDYSES